MTRLVMSGLALSLAAVLGCGGKSSRLVDGDDDDSNGGGTSGTSAGGSNTGGTAGREECRLFAARYATGSDVETKCDFDRPSLSLRCASSAGDTTVTSWDTIDAAVSDNRPIGRITFSTATSHVLDCAITISMVYDALGRPLSQLTRAAPEDDCGNSDVRYSAWDDSKRPLAGVLNRRDSVGCDGQNHSFSYDDVNQRFVIAMTGGTGSECFSLAFTYAHDADGLLDQITVAINGTPSVLDVVTLETGSICRD